MRTFTFLKSSSGIAALAILVCFNPQISEAQITLTESDAPQIGNVSVTANDTAPTVTSGAAGTNQTWDLSAIKNDIADSIVTLSPSSTPYSSDYPTCNIASRTSILGLGVTYAYEHLSSDSLTVQGTIAVSGSTIILGPDNPAVKGFNFPTTYGAHWKGSYRNIEKYAVDASGDSVEGIILYSYADTVDGWGTVTTPAGQFDVLRVKYIYTTLSDSSFEYIAGSGWFFAGVSSVPQSETYEWVASSGKGVVAEISYNNIGSSPSAASYQKSSVTGIPVLNNNSSVLVYPNPASSSINIVLKSTTQNGYIKITDLTGREIENVAFANAKAQLNTSNYPDGMYIYSITDINGNLLDNGKFCVAH